MEALRVWDIEDLTFSRWLAHRWQWGYVITAECVILACGHFTMFSAETRMHKVCIYHLGSDNEDISTTEIMSISWMNGISNSGKAWLREVSRKATTTVNGNTDESLEYIMTSYGIIADLIVNSQWNVFLPHLVLIFCLFVSEAHICLIGISCGCMWMTFHFQFFL